jgi:phosphotriesterase-related protein
MGFNASAIYTIADTGCYIEYDTFGHKGSFPTILPDMPNDAQRINDIINLINQGYINKILISMDHCFKHDLVTYGGSGYAHILINVIPDMKAKGISDKQIQTILIDNPRRALLFT